MSNVYFTDLRTSPNRNLFQKLDDLLNRVKISTIIKKDSIIAIKLHFGERGNTAYIRPVFLRIVVNKVKAIGAKPFLTDTTTLYKGSRSDAVSHLTTAILNGFDYAIVDCPIIIADGLHGSHGSKVTINGDILKTVTIAKDIVDADCLIVVTHFKAHELSGFGGALKNVGMGCATKEGKLVQHSMVAPRVNEKNCKGCKLCTGYCPAGAISVTDKKAFINDKKCIGCGECIMICPSRAIEIQFIQPQDVFQKTMVEHAFGALKGKEKKSLFINFLMQISPACDCYPHNDAPIVQDIGILASTDPVSIDAASCDLVNNEPSLTRTAIKKALKGGEDKWKALFPSIDWNIQLTHAEKLGMGERTYTIIKI